MTVRCLSEEQQVNLCIDRMVHKLTLAELAVMYGVSTTTVNKVLSSYKQTRPYCRIQMTAAEYRSILSKYDVTEDMLEPILKEYTSSYYKPFFII